jgi:cation:H+ antiporter
MGLGMTLLVFSIGLIMIVKGGDWFLDATIWIAEKTGVSYGIIGATLVSLATTLPEFFVSTIASKEGFSDIAIGNALGSYICNIAFIVGVCSLIKPIKINDKIFGLKGVMMLGYLCIFYIFASDGLISQSEGKILVSLIFIFILTNIFEYKKNRNKGKKINTSPNKKGEVTLICLKFIIGALLIVYGADLLVDTGVEIANILKIPKQVISLTLLAVGTSLPELVTALTSIVKGHQNISVGNILGANIINISIVIGASALVSQEGLLISRQTLILDIPMASIVALIFIIAGIYTEKINRFVGVALLSIYGWYLYILF